MQRIWVIELENNLGQWEPLDECFTDSAKATESAIRRCKDQPYINYRVAMYGRLVDITAQQLADFRADHRAKV